MNNDNILELQQAVNELAESPGGGSAPVYEALDLTDTALIGQGDATIVTGGEATVTVTTLDTEDVWLVHVEANITVMSVADGEAVPIQVNVSGLIGLAEAPGTSIALGTRPPIPFVGTIAGVSASGYIFDGNNDYAIGFDGSPITDILVDDDRFLFRSTLIVGAD
jgi:hypothetical protein